MIIIQKHLKVYGNISDVLHDAAIVSSESFKSKTKKTRKSSAAGNTKDVEIATSLKYLSNVLLKCL